MRFVEPDAAGVASCWITVAVTVLVIEARWNRVCGVTGRAAAMSAQP